MNCPDRPAGSVSRIEVSVAELLNAARARLERQRQYAAALSRGGARAAAIRGCIDSAAACVAALARPEVVVMTVAARAVAGGTEIAGRVVIDHPDAAEAAAGGMLTASLVTLNFAQEQAFDWLGRDYGIHHIQTALAGETLFALARTADRAQQASAPGRRLRRISLQAQQQCGRRRLWSVEQVRAILGAFDAENPGVTMTDTGFFRPSNSLLGLTILR